MVRLRLLQDLCTEHQATMKSESFRPRSPRLVHDNMGGRVSLGNGAPFFPWVFPPVGCVYVHDVSTTRTHASNAAASFWRAPCRFVETSTLDVVVLCDGGCESNGRAPVKDNEVQGTFSKAAWKPLAGGWAGEIEGMSWGAIYKGCPKGNSCMRDGGGR